MDSKSSIAIILTWHAGAPQSYLMLVHAGDFVFAKPTTWSDLRALPERFLEFPFINLLPWHNGCLTSPIHVFINRPSSVDQLLTWLHLLTMSAYLEDFKHDKCWRETVKAGVVTRTLRYTTFVRSTQLTTNVTSLTRGARKLKMQKVACLWP